MELPLQMWPPLSRCTALGAMAAGILGGIVGLLVGWAVNPGTAWFAVFELGVPAALVGAVVGFVFGTIVVATRRVRSTRSGAVRD